MANKIIDLTGNAIETALQLVDTSVSVNQAPTSGSAYFCTSGTLHTYINNAINGSLNNGPKITANSFSNAVLVDQQEGMSDATNISNAKLATTAAIRDYVQAQPRSTASNIAFTPSTGVNITNSSANATINGTPNAEGNRVNVNIVANENAHYLILGTTVIPSGAMGQTTTTTYFDFFSANSSDVLLNLSQQKEVNLTIIRFV